MTLYTKKKGEFVPMTRQQIRRLRRHEEVIELQNATGNLVMVSRALAAWLYNIQKKALKLDAKDLTVTRLPNVERVQDLCDRTQTALDELRKM